MNAAVTKILQIRQFISLLKTQSVCLALVFMFSGCLTSSPEDDYVAGILAEAVQNYGPVGEMPSSPVGNDVGHAESISQPLATSVSAPLATSVSAPSLVSVPAGTTVSVTQPPVVIVPVPVAAPITAVPLKPVPIAHAPIVAEPVVQAVAIPVMNSDSSLDKVQPSNMDESGVGVVPSVAFTKAAMPKPSIATIQPDSILWITVAEDPSLSGRYMVNDASAIDFGYVGLVFLPDLSVEQAEAEVKRVLEGRYLKTATVSVKLAKASYDRVSVQGKVAMPGEIKIGPGATISLNEALRRAGGLRAGRENTRVKVVRGGVKTPFGAAAEGDVYPLMAQNGQLKVPDIFLRNDDLAYVFTPSTEEKGRVEDSAMTGMGGKRVILLGEVPRRGVIEFSENEPCTLMYLLFKIGGLPRFARGDKISVVRRDKDGLEKKFMVNGEKLMKSGKPEDDLVLETGDRIVVPSRSISFL